MTAKKTDNRARPKIHRTDDKHDKRLRDWAAKQGLDPWQALEMAIDWLGAPPRTAADLESAREATRRADAEVERLTRELAFTKKQVERRDITAERLTEERDAARTAPQPCACALPDDFEAKLTERASGWKGTLPELRARVIALGFSRYDALATDAAKRAAAKGA